MHCPTRTMPCVTCNMCESKVVILLRQNDHKRWDTYKRCAIKLGYFTRDPLPHCVVGTIRAIFPEPDGCYVGFKMD